MDNDFVTLRTAHGQAVTQKNAGHSFCIYFINVGLFGCVVIIMYVSIFGIKMKN